MNRSCPATYVFAASACLALIGVSLPVLGQEPSTRQATAPLAVNACHVSPIVENLDRSARFYRELGLEVNLPAGNEPLPWDTDPGHLDIHGVPEGKIRFTQGRMPSVQCGVEIVEFGRVDRKAVQRAVQDPGAAMLIVRVRDLDAAFARVKETKAPIVTVGGKPIVVGPGNTRAVVLKDPDGHLIEMVQLDPAPATSIAASSNATGLGLRVTVSSLDRTLSLFQSRLGLPVTTEVAFARNHATSALVGLADVESRRSSVDVPLRPSPANPPGVGLHLEFVEFKGGPAAVRHASRIQDPGSYRLMLGMRDLGCGNRHPQGNRSSDCLDRREGGLRAVWHDPLANCRDARRRQSLPRCDAGPAAAAGRPVNAQLLPKSQVLEDQFVMSAETQRDRTPMRTSHSNTPRS